MEYAPRPIRMVAGKSKGDKMSKESILMLCNAIKAFIKYQKENFVRTFL